MTRTRRLFYKQVGWRLSGSGDTLYRFVVRPDGTARVPDANHYLPRLTAPNR